MLTKNFLSLLPPTFQGARVLPDGVIYRFYVERSRADESETVCLQGFLPFRLDYYKQDGIFIDSETIAGILDVEHKDVLKKIEQTLEDAKILGESAAKVLSKYKKIEKDSRRGVIEGYEIELLEVINFISSYATPVGRVAKQLASLFITSLREWIDLELERQGIRKESKVDRRNFTDAMKELGAEPIHYALTTTAGYINLVGHPAKELRKIASEVLGIDEKDVVIRDCMSIDNLDAVSLAERETAKELLRLRPEPKYAPKVMARVAKATKAYKEEISGKELKFEPVPPANMPARLKHSKEPKSLKPKKEPKKLK